MKKAVENKDNIVYFSAVLGVLYVVLFNIQCSPTFWIKKVEFSILASQMVILIWFYVIINPLVNVVKL